MSAGSGLRLAHDATARGTGWWTWSVWVEGPEDELDRIESVRYVLHPTFPDPIRLVKDRASRFRLEATGWGEFSIVANVKTKDGRELSLERWLTLGESAAIRGAADARRPTVYLSFSATDKPSAETLRKTLEQAGVEVVSADDLVPGSSYVDELGQGVGKAQVVAFLVTGDLRGFAEEELALARRGDKEIVPVLVGDSEAIPELLAGYQAVRMASPQAIAAVADKLVARAKDLFYPE